MRDISEIRQQIKLYQKEGKRIFATSSFQSHSIPLLHIISQIDHRIPIYYLNTGYLFTLTIGLLIGIGLEISENHRKFIRNPIIQIIGGFAFVQRSTQNTFTTLIVIFLFYASTLIISNSRKTYKDT